MKHPEMPLTLAGASVVRGANTLSAHDWRERVVQAWTAPEPTPERGLCDLVHGAAGLDARVAHMPVRAPGPLRFRDAGGRSQRDLAHAALEALFADQGRHARAERCQLLLYAAASIDSRYHQSPVGWLAATHRLADRPHFALSQLQGASLAAAAEIIDAMLPAGGAAALVAAEAWPVPFPRACAGSAPLGDAGAALWLTRDLVSGLRLHGAHQQSHDPFLVPDSGARSARIAPDRLLASAEQAIGAALARHGVAATALRGWLPSGLDPELDETLRRRCAPAARDAALPREDDGYLCCAAAPALCADVLASIRAGELEDGALLLSWGASLGGAIGVSLWRVAASAGGRP
jgi:hypothetical protein